MMSVETLSDYPALASLPIRRLRATARASREETYETGEAIPMTPDRLCILQAGKVVLYVRLCPGTRCGGETTIVVHHPGHLFGWRSVAQEERLNVQAVCQEPTQVIAIDLVRLKRSKTGLLLLEQAAGCLYALLQDTGLCPRNVADRVVLGAEECDWMDVEKLAFKEEHSR